MYQNGVINGRENKNAKKELDKLNINKRNDLTAENLLIRKEFNK